MCCMPWLFNNERYLLTRVLLVFLIWMYHSAWKKVLFDVVIDISSNDIDTNHWIMILGDCLLRGFDATWTIFCILHIYNEYYGLREWRISLRLDANFWWLFLFSILRLLMKCFGNDALGKQIVFKNFFRTFQTWWLIDWMRILKKRVQFSWIVLFAYCS